jgi:hypothetical protein
LIADIARAEKSANTARVILVPLNGVLDSAVGRA